MDDRTISALLQKILPAERIKTDLIDLVASAPDAGFYYLRPKAVVLPATESEIVQLFAFSKKNLTPLVFRAAGTSLSGQAITDGILVDISRYWDKIAIEDEGRKVRVKPGAIGSIVNSYLKKFNTKIGPDPASISAAMMGGILSNNASGMCCGVSKNAYHTIKYIRFILPNGRIYSTEIESDYERFKKECSNIYYKLQELQSFIAMRWELHDKIRQKYRTKNTVGYSLNAFIDFTEPLDILAHLLIGGEGTLGFIAEAVLETVPDNPEKATGLLFFPSIYAACSAITPLTESGAAAVELMDRASLRSIENIAEIPPIIKTLADGCAALLVEYQGSTAEEVQSQINDFLSNSPSLSLLNEPSFTTVAAEQALFWKVRKGMFPAVGAVRAGGTTVILEDVAFPAANLGNAIVDLQGLFEKHNYDNAIIFGHAKDGNIHFVITQAFDTVSEIERYDRFLKEVVNLVINKYNGALKAEHGTGRNMAPFVETEWGGELYEVMKAVKNIIDPQNLLNPGVIINAEKNAHIQHLKELYQVEEEVDKCIECGFCEHKCPSRDVTLTPRKRIVVRRELLKLKNTKDKKQYNKLLNQYQYSGLDTCAVDGLCATACPVDINTGDLVKRLRRENHTALANKIALLTARNFNAVYLCVRFALGCGMFMNKVFGNKTMLFLTQTLRKVIPSFPLWSNQLALAKSIPYSFYQRGYTTTIVYFPGCISRLMGNSSRNKETMQALLDVSVKAGINVIIPDNIKEHCCGQIYSSKGFKDAFGYAANETIAQLWESTNGGKYPVVLDISSCTQTLLKCRPVLSAENKARFELLQIIDSVEYVHDFIIPRVTVSGKKDSVVLHPVCSLQKMNGLEAKFSKVAAHFSRKITQPLFAGCCGMAGDRGFLYPELTRSATLPEAKEVRNIVYDGYYSSSKTCEIALSEAVGENYLSILNLVDECTIKK